MIHDLKFSPESCILYHVSSISKHILSDPINKWMFKSAQKLNTEAFIVGGYVRDIIRGVLSKDKDYAIKDDVEDIAAKTAKKFNGTFIPLKQGVTYRVVLKNKEVLDFSCLEETIREDLKRRDFTINAIAWSPETGIIDLSNGIEDLKHKTIRAVRIKNLIDDPLRILRAYRFASELGFEIEQNTRKNLKRLSKGLSNVALERITDELFKLLNNKNADRYLIECLNDKVLENVFKIEPDNLAQNLKFLKKFNLFYNELSNKLHKTLEEEISQGLSRIGIIRLAILLIDSSLKDTCLRVSTDIKKSLSNIHDSYTIASETTAEKEFSKGNIFKIFKASGKSILESCVFLSFMLGYNLRHLLNEAEKYKEVKNKMLLDGNDVQRVLNIKADARIGKILLALQEEQFKGSICTKAEAKKWVLKMLTNEH
ncbi:MAG: CCA tRNA nucleotidyltransferase [Nitrospirae bacterium]|nr:CCA tRNA nucleotidyltransferase [Nitrospirota bacterium]